MFAAFQDLLDSGVTSDDLNRHIATESLAGFVQVMWPYFDPADFIPNWHIDAICEHLEGVSYGEIKRLLINIPPRHMKSIAVAVTWPAWTWAQQRTRGYPLLGPQTNFMFASYAQALSVRDAVKSRRLMSSPMYRRLFGHRFQFVGDQNTKVRYENNHRGVRVATSVDSMLTGEGADIICIDDPHNVREAESDAVRESVLVWWDEAMQTRLNDPRTGAYVVIMQRVHERDLSGHILTRNHKDWTHLCLPGEFEVDHPHRFEGDKRTIDGEPLWPKRMGPEQLATLKNALGSYAYAGQVQQRPAPREGGMFKRRWFKIVDEVPKRVRRRVRAWDLASTEAVTRANPDWTVGVKMARDPDGMVYVEDMVRIQGQRDGCREGSREHLSSGRLFMQGAAAARPRTGWQSAGGLSAARARRLRDGLPAGDRRQEYASLAVRGSVRGR